MEANVVSKLANLGVVFVILSAKEFQFLALKAI